MGHVLEPATALGTVLPLGLRTAARGQCGRRSSARRTRHPVPLFSFAVALAGAITAAAARLSPRIPLQRVARSAEALSQPSSRARSARGWAAITKARGRASRSFSSLPYGALYHSMFPPLSSPSLLQLLNVSDGVCC